MFTLTVAASYAGTQTLGMTPATTDDNLGFSTPGTANGTVSLNITIGVALTPDLSAEDATSVVLNGLTAAGNRLNTTATFPIGVGLLGASANGTINLNTLASVTMVSDGTGTPQAYTVGDIVGVNAVNLLNVTEQAVHPHGAHGIVPVRRRRPSATSAADREPLISGDPLSGAGLAVGFTGTAGDQFPILRQSRPLRPAWRTVHPRVGDGRRRPGFRAVVDVPLTDLSVGQAADFGSMFNADVIDALSNDSTHTPIFASIQQFQTDLAALSGSPAPPSPTSSSSNQIDIGFTLAETFNAAPTSFTYDLTAGRRHGPGRPDECHGDDGDGDPVDQRHRHCLTDVRLRPDAECRADQGGRCRCPPTAS